MRKRTVRARAPGRVIGASLVLLLWVPEPAPAAPPPGPSSRSVKDLRHKVSPNGRHLVDQGGKPLFCLGDTCWLLRGEVYSCGREICPTGHLVRDTEGRKRGDKWSLLGLK